MAASRRSFLGFLFGAAAAAPALPEIVKAAVEAPTSPSTDALMRARLEELIEKTIRPPICYVDAIDWQAIHDEYSDDLGFVRTSLPSQAWRRLTS